MFEQFGNITRAHVVTEGLQQDGSRPSKGFGFVTMSTDEEAKTSMEFWNGRAYKGRDLRVQLSKRSKGHGRDSS